MKGERIWGIYCNGVFLCCITDRKHDHAQSISGVENVSPEVSPLPKAGWKKCLFSVKGGGCGVVSLVVQVKTCPTQTTPIWQVRLPTIRWSGGPFLAFMVQKNPANHLHRTVSAGMRSFLEALCKLYKIICWLTNDESIRPIFYCADTMEELILKK